MAIYRNNNANALNVINAVKAELKSLSHYFPPGVNYLMSYDPTSFIRAAMAEIIETLLITFVLVVLITYLFLQDWRATLIPTLAIPVALVGTFVFMVALGMSMNILTMFALILVIGSLVDDAIIVVENTMRLIEEEKLSPKEAAVKSMRQITGCDYRNDAGYGGDLCTDRFLWRHGRDDLHAVLNHDLYFADPVGCRRSLSEPGAVRADSASASGAGGDFQTFQHLP